MDAHDVKPDPPLSADQTAVVESLTERELAEIDQALLANCADRWRKVAAVVGRTMTDEVLRRFPGIPDVYFGRRVRQLVERGVLEASGNLDSMRYSEVRLRQ